jgi:hypothetical protein
MKPRLSSLLSLALTFFASSLLNAQPSPIHLTLQAKTRSDATTPVTVTWYNDYTRGKQFVKYGVPVKKESGPTLSAGAGTVYITNGTAGGNPTGSGGKNLDDMAFIPDKSMYHFAIMDVCSDSLTYRVFDQNNTLVDRFTISK